MNILKSEEKLCMCCMEVHAVQTVRVTESTYFKGRPVQYEAIHEYCDRTDFFDTPESLISANDITMKNAYRQSVGLLTSQDIVNIRKKYGISQTDLAALLGWGAKTVTRYEGHQVQDSAHDTILRKLADDPEWFLQLLEKSRGQFSEGVYQKYHETAEALFRCSHDLYLRKSLLAQYATINGHIEECGNSPLNIDKIVDAICYYSSSGSVSALYKVKLMKLLWYADNLLFKRTGHSLTGLAYSKQPMGAVPIGHRTLIDLQGVHYQEIEFDDDKIGYKFLPVEGYHPQFLTAEDLDALGTVASICGTDTKDQIVSRMHAERAFLETADGEIIPYRYAAALSID